MDVGGDVVTVRDCLRRPDVVEMSVGEQHRARRQVGSGEELVQRFGGVLTGIDDDALLRVVLREDVAVGLEHPGGESGYEHEHRSYGEDSSGGSYSVGATPGPSAPRFGWQTRSGLTSQLNHD